MMCESSWSKGEKKIEVFVEVFECVEVYIDRVEVTKKREKKSIEIGLAQHIKQHFERSGSEATKRALQGTDTIELLWTTTGCWDLGLAFPIPSIHSFYWTTNYKCECDLCWRKCV